MDYPQSTLFHDFPLSLRKCSAGIQNPLFPTCISCSFLNTDFSTSSKNHPVSKCVYAVALHTQNPSHTLSFFPLLHSRSFPLPGTLPSSCLHVYLASSPRLPKLPGNLQGSKLFVRPRKNKCCTSQQAPSFLFRRFRKIANSDFQLYHVRPSVRSSICLHGTRIPASILIKFDI